VKEERSMTKAARMLDRLMELIADRTFGSADTLESSFEWVAGEVRRPLMTERAAESEETAVAA